MGSRRTSILPATAVLVIAVLVLGVFVIVDVTTSSSTTPTTLPAIVEGGLQPVAHSPVFKGDACGGTPPGDVASVFIVPKGTRKIRSVLTGGSACESGDYDVELQLLAHAPRPELLGFYVANLHRLGWTLFSKGGSGEDDDELLFEKAGSDGNYWEAGIVAQPSAGGATSYSFRLFVADSDM